MEHGPETCGVRVFRRNTSDSSNTNPMIMPTNAQGYAMLPDRWHPEWTLDDRKNLIRTFMTMRLRQWFQHFQTFLLISYAPFRKIHQ